MVATGAWERLHDIAVMGNCEILTVENYGTNFNLYTNNVKRHRLDSFALRCTARERVVV